MRAWHWIGACNGALLVALLAGCADGPPPRHAQVNLSGYSAAFKQGYGDGCESAGGRTSRRHEGRYKTEADYMAGWNDGFSACQRRR